MSSENISCRRPLKISFEQAHKKLALNRDFLLVLKSLYVMTDWIIDQNKTLRRTSDSCKHPTVHLIVFHFSIGFHPNDENFLYKLLEYLKNITFLTRWRPD